MTSNRIGVLAIILAGALVGGWCAVRAQPAANCPWGYGTPELAGKEFCADLSRQDDLCLLRLTSQKSKAELGEEGVRRIIQYFEETTLASRWSSAAPAATGQSAATVNVTAALPVAVVREQVEKRPLWRVDLVATLSHSENLDKEGTARKVFGLTGVALPGARIAGAEDTRLCLENLHRIGVAMQAYLQDNDMRYPNARNWCEAIEKYGVTDAQLRCPAAGPGAYGYAMNWKFSGRPESLVDMRQRMVAVYETQDSARDGRGSGADLSLRHDDGANYLYAGSGAAAWHPRNEAQSFAFNRE